MSKNTKYAILKENYAKILKIAIGTAIAIWLADFVGLQYSSSAGIITLLSIQDTKKDTIKIALKRMVSFVVAIVIALVLFQTLGYRVYVFGIFLAIFVSVCCFFQLMDGVAMNAVLTTHFLANQSMNVESITNEVGIFLIGVAVGIVLNLFMKNDVSYIRESMKNIEEEMKEVFLVIANVLKGNKTIGQKNNGLPEEKLAFAEIKVAIQLAIEKAEKNQKNQLFSNSSYYTEYLLMRKQQVAILQRVYRQMERLNQHTEQAEILATFFENLTASFHEYNNSEALLQDLEQMLANYQTEALPKTRGEFENRALMYTAIRDMELFLQTKREFVLSLTDREVERYWDKKREESKGTTFFA